jgi:hypothetical protein
VRAWLDRISCRLGRCRKCRLYETDLGIGGQCVTCGKIHGWMTRAELRAVCDADMHAREGGCE